MDSALSVPMVTPTKNPTIAVNEERKLRSRAKYHDNPVDRRMAKSPEMEVSAKVMVLVDGIGSI